MLYQLSYGHQARNSRTTAGFSDRRKFTKRNVPQCNPLFGLQNGLRQGSKVRSSFDLRFAPGGLRQRLHRSPSHLEVERET
jgi:hypothetical protein